MATTTVANKVYEIPELLSIICGYATSNACLSILCASKSGFRAATPIVWASVVGIVNILKLIPKVIILEGSSVVSSFLKKSTLKTCELTPYRISVLSPLAILRGSSSTRLMFDISKYTNLQCWNFSAGTR
jgi:hypothetical protein